MASWRDNISASPLSWPVGRERTRNREQARFDCTFTSARDAVLREVAILVAGGTRYFNAERSIIISSNTPLRRDGLPLAGYRMPDDPGVAVYFERLTGGHPRQMAFACDRWMRVEHNMQAIAKTIEAMRGIERWGTGSMVEAAFRGFEALPAPEPWHVTLGVHALTPTHEVRQQYRLLRSQNHPDKTGGDATKFDRIQRAWTVFCAERGLTS